MCVCVFACMSGALLLYALVPLCVCVCVCVRACERACLVRRVVGGKRLTFPHSWGHLGHAPG